jgi:hypothetical protein
MHKYNETPPAASRLHGGICAHCGAEILPRRLRDKVVGRDRRFCSNKCRQAAFRNADFARRHHPLGALRNDQKSSVISEGCEGDFPGRASSPIDNETWREVLDTEQPWRGCGELTVSADGVQSFIVGRLRRSR